MFWQRRKVSDMKTHPLRHCLRIAVIGPNECSPEEYEWGRAVGREIAKAGAMLICGGLGGMMEAAAAGAHEVGGLTLGILPSHDDSTANPHIDIPLPTGLGEYRNILVVRAAHAVIAISGRYGTLTEMAYALRLNTPLVALHSWELLQNGNREPAVHAVTSPEEAVRLAIQLAQKARSR